jgi:hypothetical protein
LFIGQFSAISLNITFREIKTVEQRTTKTRQTTFFSLI